MGAAPIGPGDYIECIDAGPRYVAGWHAPLIPPNLVEGAVYMVEWVGTEPFWPEVPGVRLAGNRAPNHHGTYQVDRFRPVYRRDETLTARLLSDIPADAPASPEEVVA